MAFKRSVKGQQRRMRMLSVKLDGTGTAALDGSDKFSMTLTDNGVGDYTLTYDSAYQRAPEVFVTSITTGIHCEVTASSATACTIETFDVATGATPTDADMYVLIVGSDDADAI